MDAAIQLWYSTALTAEQRVKLSALVSWALGTQGGDKAMPATLRRPGEQAPSNTPDDMGSSVCRVQPCMPLR